LYIKNEGGNMNLLFKNINEDFWNEKELNNILKRRFISKIQNKIKTIIKLSYSK
jgi:hypothetical protein